MNSGPSKPQKDWKKDALLSLFVVIFAFASVEILVRIVEGGPSGIIASVSSLRESVEMDPVFDHRWRPNLAFQDNSRNSSYTLYTNKQRWPEKYDVTVEKPKDVYRIFYLGDSNTQGVVAHEKKMAKIVEKKLNEIYLPKGKKIEVINTGTSSFGIVQYFLVTKLEILKYSPDLLVIDVDMTDVPDDHNYRRTAVFDEKGDVLAIHPPKDRSFRLTPHGAVEITGIDKVRELLARHLHSFRLLERTVAKVLPSKPGVVQMPKPAETKDSADWLAKEWTPDIQKNVDISMKQLGSLIELLKSHNVKVVITGVPHYPQYTGEWSVRPHAVLEETTRAHGAFFLNSYEALRGQILGTSVDKYYWSVDPTHFNEAGNTIWANAQLEFLLKNRESLLPSDRGDRRNKL